MFRYKLNDLIIMKSGMRYRVIEDSESELGFILEMFDSGAYHSKDYIEYVLGKEHEVFRVVDGTRGCARDWASILEENSTIPSRYEKVFTNVKVNAIEMTVKQISNLLGYDVIIVKG